MPAERNESNEKASALSASSKGVNLPTRRHEQKNVRLFVTANNRKVPRRKTKALSSFFVPVLLDAKAMQAQPTLPTRTLFPLLA